MHEIRFPSNSNIRYLPLVYFLPESTMLKCPTLCRLPRNVRAVVYSEENMDIVNSDSFLQEVMDATASLVFPVFGFGGWKEHYTGDSPAWKLSYSVSLWMEMLEKETGWGLNSLMRMPGTKDIPFLESAYIKEVTERFVRRGIQEANFQPIFDALREMPCDEDFERWNTNARKDFHRRWYHSRSKKAKMISLQECLKSNQHEIHRMKDAADSFEDRVLSEMSYQHFKDKLSPQDLVILDLRMEGFTYQQIAARLGYKTHSAVLKRARAIAKAFRAHKEDSQ